MLAHGMESRGHNVAVIKPNPMLNNLPLPVSLKKWAGYIDQYIIFPFIFRRKLNKIPPETLFVFVDNALGPYVPIVCNRKHIIHCHDFMAQKAAKGEIKENKISLTGKLYQSFIKKGYLSGKNFISVSQRTKNDLDNILINKAEISEVVYNGLNPNFKPVEKYMARKEISVKLDLNLNSGFMLHVGGNLWYKNRTGVIEIYNMLRAKNLYNKPLLLIGESANETIASQIYNSPYSSDIFIKNNLEEDTLNIAYNAADFFIFPSLEEGFGWPIAEAMACNTLVITTNEMPMTEVGGNAAFYIPKRPFDSEFAENWCTQSVEVIVKMLELNPNEIQDKINLGRINIERFNLNTNIEKIEAIYSKVK